MNSSTMVDGSTMVSPMALFRWRFVWVMALGSMLLPADEALGGPTGATVTGPDTAPDPGAVGAAAAGGGATPLTAPDPGGADAASLMGPEPGAWAAGTVPLTTVADPDSTSLRRPFSSL